MKNVYICSPLKGDKQKNLENAKRYAKYAFEGGTAPVVPHFYAEILDDDDTEDRQTGMRAAVSLMWQCDECWVFGEEITEGMKMEISFAEKLNITIRYFSEDKSGGTIIEKNKKKHSH